MDHDAIMPHESLSTDMPVACSLARWLFPTLYPFPSCHPLVSLVQGHGGRERPRCCLVSQRGTGSQLCESHVHSMSLMGASRSGSFSLEEHISVQLVPASGTKQHLEESIKNSSHGGGRRMARKNSDML